MYTMTMKNNGKRRKKRRTSSGGSSRRKDGVSTAQSARESSINILGMNRKKELDLNYKGG